MPVDREFWNRLVFTLLAPPELQCPSCNHGGLQLDRKSVSEGSTRNTHRNQSHPDWDNEFWEGRFCCLFTCANTNCGETIAVTGRSSADLDHEQGYYSVFHPTHFIPPLNIFPIPRECPANVAHELQLAFNLFFTDLAGGMNHLRKAVELILDHLKIPRKGKTKKGTFALLSLHNRIERFRSKKKTVLADRLEAIKWLGNVGSHSSDVSRDTFFDTCDLLEDFIHAHFGKRREKIVTLTKKVIKRKGS